MLRGETPRIEVKRRLFLDIAALSQKDAELLFEITHVCLNSRTGLCKKERERAEHQCHLRELLLQ